MVSLLFFLMLAVDPEVARQKHARCVALYSESKLDEAEACWRGNLAEAERAGDAKFRLRSLSNLPTVARRKGRYAEAVELNQRVIQEALAQGDSEMAANSHDNLGLVLFQLGRYEESFASFDAAGALLGKLGNEERLAFHNAMYADVLRVSDRLAESEEHFRKALAAADRLNQKQVVYASLSGLGNVTRMRGALTKALDYFERARGLAREMKRISAVSEITGNIGYVYYLMGDDEQAVVQYREALAGLRIARDPVVEHQVRGRLALPLIALRRFDEAKTEIRLAIEYETKSGDAYSLVGARRVEGRLELERRQWDAARSALLESLAGAEKLGNQTDQVQTLAVLAEVELRAGDRAAAGVLAGKLRDLAGRVEDPETLTRAWLAAGRVSRAEGKYEEAIAALGKAVEEADRFRNAAGGRAEQQISLTASVAPAHVELADLYGATGRGREGLLMAERAKAHTLRSLLASGREADSSGLTTGERAEEQRLRAGLLVATRGKSAAAGAGEVRKARLAMEDFRNRVYAGHSGGLGEVPTVEWARVSGAAPFALEYLVGPEKVTLFVVSSGRVRAVRLVISAEELKARVAAFRGQLAARDLGFRAAAQELHRVLIAPAGAMPGKVVVVPDGVLWDLPFQALIDGPELTLAPSLAALDLLSRRAAGVGGGKPLWVADSAVPEGAEQVRAFASAMGGGGSVLAGREATEGAVKAAMGGASALHFTAHGVVEPGAPWYSRLEVGASAGEDGWLEAWEVLRRPLRARVAVLAACETGRGKVLAGEGLAGLNWAFLGAGARATVVSQWKVDSAATGALFQVFYARLAAGASVAGALREASQAVRRDPRWSHPFYWAAFFASGR